MLFRFGFIGNKTAVTQQGKLYEIETQEIKKQNTKEQKKTDIWECKNEKHAMAAVKKQHDISTQ